MTTSPFTPERGPNWLEEAANRIKQEKAERDALMSGIAIAVPAALLRELLLALGGDFTLETRDLVSKPPGELLIHEYKDPWMMKYEWRDL